MKKIMAIFAHPDDENIIGGTLAYYTDKGDEVVLVCATRGEVGQISDPALATRETIGEVRQKELEKACAILGIQHLEFLDRRDSGMDGTDENKDPRALIQSNPDEIKGQIVEVIRKYKPDIVITFEPFGWYGHPDHKFTSKWVTEAYPMAGDANAYPDKGSAWQPKRLFHSAMRFSNFRTMIDEAIEAGYITEEDFKFDIPEEEILRAETQITHDINRINYYDRQQEAMRAHQTQFGEDSPFRKIPEEILRKGWGNEYYIQVYPEPDPTLRENQATDLFA
jgi:LmbE family N-acetylglucosaminyl deacetylase